MKHKVLIIVLSIIFVIFSSLSIIGYIEHNKDNKSNIDDDNKVVDNDNNIEDENVINDEDIINDDDNEYIEEKELFIYFDKEYDKFLIYTYEIDGSEQEYIDSYKCINDSCKYSLDKNILAVYDDNKVLYKDLNKKEDFKESKIEKTYEYYDKYQDEYVNIKSYKILDNYYFVTNETNFFQEYDYDYTFDHATLEDGYVLTYDWRKDDLYIIIYDIYKEQMVASIIRDSSTGSDTFRKYNDFYIVHMYKGDIQDYIFTSNFELIDVRYPDVNAFSYTGDLNYYIKDDIIYYIDYNEEVSQLIVKDKDNNKIDYPNKNIQPLFIQDSYLLYLEEDNSIKIKDLSNDKIIVDSNLKFNQKNFWYFYIENNNFYIEYYDESVKKTKEWEIAKSKYDGSVDYEPGYLIEFDKNNKLIRKEISVLECYWCY